MYNDALIGFHFRSWRYDGRPLSLEKDLSIRGLHSCAIHREMAFRRPRYTRGKTDAPVELRDNSSHIFLDAADVTIPTDMDGRSLLPLAKRHGNNLAQVSGSRTCHLLQ